MFSSREQLRKRTPTNGTDRESFLSLLVDEYLNTSSLDAKVQVLANLANFSYDPINYNYIRNVGVLDVFLHVLKSEHNNNQLLQFASAGICNLCIDPLNAEYIIQNNGLTHLIPLLKNDNTEIIVNVLTILIYLPNTGAINSEIIQTVKGIKNSNIKTASNLATIFLQDVCKIDCLNP